MKAVLALGAVGLAVVALAANAVTGGDGRRSPSASATSTATTEISRQDLVEVESESGTLGHGDSRAVVNRLAGTVTWLPAAGAAVKPGERLYEVDGKPVILMDGRVPAYRTLDASVSEGPDVAQLERNLRELGYDPYGAIALDHDWDTGTTAAVRRWQEANGLGETGSIGLGRVIFQPGRRRIESIDLTLGGDTTAAAGVNDATASATPRTAFASYTPPADEQSEEEKELEEREDELRRREAELRRREREQKRRERRERREQEQREAGSGDERSGSGGGQTEDSTGEGADASQDGGGGASDGGASDGRASGGGTAGASQVMTTTSTRPVVTVDLDTAKVSIARKGAGVTVELPSGETVRGRVMSVGKVAASDSAEGAEGAEEDPTVEVTIRLRRRTRALDQAPATVNFERSRRRNVLAIPVTALLARSGGRFAVEVRDGGRRRLVPVTPGLYAGGYVEIEGDGLEEGMKVTDARV